MVYTTTGERRWRHMPSEHVYLVGEHPGRLPNVGSVFTKQSRGQPFLTYSPRARDLDKTAPSFSRRPGSSSVRLASRTPSRSSASRAPPAPAFNTPEPSLVEQAMAFDERGRARRAPLKHEKLVW